VTGAGGNVRGTVAGGNLNGGGGRAVFVDVDFFFVPPSVDVSRVVGVERSPSSWSAARGSSGWGAR
jgi:hypothetical protein